MFLTSREQKLIHTFLKRGTLTIPEMMEITGTSRRTLYRDLNNLQKSLPEEISLQTSEEGYFIKGDIKQLSQAHELVEYTMTERLYGEILLLIENKASILSLTDYFGISQPTVTNDLRQLEQTLLENEISLIRERGLKIE
ncbi:DeoR family transcriptional regulator, partial [Streptococcus thermophilus]|nr:DeoR family transcriptional regulator [Streptococcus thermophilus]